MPDDQGSRTVFAALVPDATLEALIQGFKDRVRSVAGDQLYLDDPPHLTVYLAAYASSAAAVDLWRRFARTPAAIPIRLTGWHVFEADALTGNHTLVCDVAAEDKPLLRQLQCTVIEQLASARDLRATRERFAPRWRYLTADQQLCVERVGFPYVGAGWEPHFTIASVSVEAWDQVWREMKSQPPRGAFACRGLRLYQLVDNRPVPLTDIGR